MQIPWFGREYERTCGDCGHAWRVPVWAVHPNRQALPASAGPGFAGQTDGVVAANAALAERAAVYRQCAECSSVRYKQRRVKP
jgi:hypothetical protein